MIEIFNAIILGIVQGISEWLPISSTGHMILVDEFIKMKMSEQFMSTFYTLKNLILLILKNLISKKEILLICGKRL